MVTANSVIPADVELEACVLASILNDPFDGQLCFNRLEEADFSNKTYKFISSGITEAISKNYASTDIVEIASILKSRVNGAPVGIVELLKLKDEAPICVDIDSGIKRLIDLKKQRQIQSFLNESGKKITPGSDSSELLSEINTFITAMEKDSSLELKAVNAADYLSHEPQKPDQILENTLDRGDKMAVIASSKMNKTMLVNQFGLSLASNSHNFLTWYIPKPRRVLMIQLEVTADHFHRRIRRLSKAMGITAKDIGDRLQIVNGRGLYITGAKGIEKIRKVAGKHKPEVIIIDPLYKIADGVENAAEDMKIILAEFDRLAEDTGAAIVYVHHDGKGTPGEKKITDRGSGSGVLGRDYDAAIVLTPHMKIEGATVVECVLRNYAPKAASVIVWGCSASGDAYCFRVDDSVPPEKKTQQSKQPQLHFMEYVQAAKSILGVDELEIAIFKADFKDLTGLSNNRINDFVSWATAGAMPYLIDRSERGYRKNKKWLKFAENRV
jgi:hypothetical protein